MPSTTHEVMPPLQSSLPPMAQDFTLFENHADMTPHDDAAALFGPSLPAQCNKLIVGATVGNDGRTEQCERNNGLEALLSLIPTLGEGGDDSEKSVEGSSPEGAAVPCDDPMEDWACFDRPMFGGEAELMKSSRGEQYGVAGHLFVACGDQILTGGASQINNKDSTSALVDQQEQSDDWFEELLNNDNAAPSSASMEGLSASLPETVEADPFLAALKDLVAPANHFANPATSAEDQNQPTAFATGLDDLWSELCDPSQIDTSPIPALCSPTESNVSTDFSPFLSPLSIATDSFPTSPVSVFFPPSPSPSEEITVHVQKSKDEKVDHIDTLQKHKDGNYYCPHPGCKRPFERRYNLKTHYAAKHAAMRDYPCGVCLRSFARKYDMVRHMKTKHGVTGHVVVGGRVSKPGKSRAGKTKVSPSTPLFAGSVESGGM